jgi:hypothetical protein
MSSSNTHYPLVKLPGDLERILFLIREELKLTRFFRALADAGFSDPDLRPCLDSLILKELGLAQCTDDFFRHYLDIMDKHSASADGSNDSFTEQALCAYEALRAVVGSPF